MTEQKSYNRKRNIPVCIRLSEKEYEQLEKRLVKAKLNKTSYLVRLLLGKEIVVYDFDQDLKTLVFELNKAGVNLNQVARNLNASIYQDLAQDVKAVNQKQIEIYNRLLNFIETVNVVQK